VNINNENIATGTDAEYGGAWGCDDANWLEACRRAVYRRTPTVKALELKQGGRQRAVFALDKLIHQTIPMIYLIDCALGGSIIWAIARDATEIEAREKPFRFTSGQPPRAGALPPGAGP
jgi:hypothetical protein